VAERLAHSGCGRKAGAPPIDTAPSSATCAGRKFIGGLPMKPATKALAGE
jgi:hypothetical protein